MVGLEPMTFRSWAKALTDWTIPAANFENYVKIYFQSENEQDSSSDSYSYSFHGNHGKNIQLSSKNSVASRTASYNQGITLMNKCMKRNIMFRIRIDSLNSDWSSSLMLGVLEMPPHRLSFPVSATGFKKSSWIIQGDSVFNSGVKVSDCLLYTSPSPRD